MNVECLLYVWVFEFVIDQVFDCEDGVLRIGDCLVFGDLVDELIFVFGEGDDGSCCLVVFVVCEYVWC